MIIKLSQKVFLFIVNSVHLPSANVSIDVLREDFLFAFCFKYSTSNLLIFRSDQIRSVTQSCPILCDPMNCSTPGLPVHNQHPDLTQTHIHRVSDAIQPSHHPLSSPSPLAPNPSQHQSLFQ